MLMKIPTDVLLDGYWNEGEVMREVWIAGSDSDSENSDYDENKTTQEGGFRFRVVNPYYGYDSDSPVGDGDGSVTIYPGPDHQCSKYRHADFIDFSQTATNKYNHDTGYTFEFVELVKASVVTTDEAASIVVIFKACQSDDTIATSFRAKASSAFKILKKSYDIETLVPLYFDSDISS